jgi:hypothetical protein
MENADPIDALLAWVQAHGGSSSALARSSANARQLVMTASLEATVPLLSLPPELLLHARASNGDTLSSSLATALGGLGEDASEVRSQLTCSFPCSFPIQPLSTPALLLR